MWKVLHDTDVTASKSLTLFFKICKHNQDASLQSKSKRLGKQECILPCIQQQSPFFLHFPAAYTTFYSHTSTFQ